MEDIEEVVGNLIENGCKFGKKKIEIKLFNISDGEIKIEISDDGPGLPNQKMNEVFARGFRLDEQTSGTGLGLNIVKNLVDLHNGQIKAENNKNKGAKVEIILPAI